MASLGERVPKTLEMAQKKINSEQLFHILIPITNQFALVFDDDVMEQES